MENVLLVALAKHLEKKVKENGPLAVGEHNVAGNVIFKVKGVVKKGDDVQYTPTVDIPLLPTLALCLEKAGFMREKMMQLLTESMTEALTLEEKGEEHVKARCNNVIQAMEHVRSITAALPKKVKSGATRVEVEVESMQLV